ncbi:hypothetical protein JZ751_006860 [Albula glossodonta]|uniref:F5/8 type C domain-containing protein n=1 Tax=Albula glossodonta TaxID=121402 RepID=A0A8T2P2K9_9TELE|nr:hypothetical protein JZ751_006860 [Albula glossodonta]
MKKLLLVLIFLSIYVVQSLADTKEFYIAAVELGWDYLHQESLESPLVQRKRIIPSKDGIEQHLKAVYWEYKDATFSTPKAKPPWMGAGYDDATSHQEKEDDAIPPGGYYRYVWDIHPTNGPTLTDPDCLTYTYSSQVDIIRDFNSGLIGTLLICKAGSMKRTSQQNIPEFILLFAIFDETKSWYGESTFRERFQQTKPKKLYHTINGYVNSTLQGLKMCRKTSVIWHLVGMGSSQEIHSIHFQGHTLQVQNHRKVNLEVTPMSLATAVMKPIATGKFLISCQIHSHQKAGMRAFFFVEDCPEQADNLDKKYVDHSEGFQDYDVDYMANTIMVNPILMARSTVKLRPKVWTHYIAAEEITWDYAPDLSERDRTLAMKYLERGPRRIGKEYKKAVYVEYTDESFRNRKTEIMGLVGPVLRGEVEDQIKIVFMNRASQPFNIYPNDLTSIHSTGKVSLKGQALRSHAVQPNETFVYLWKITSEDGPTEADPKCLTRLYQSTIDPERDVASGLIGPLSNFLSIYFTGNIFERDKVHESVLTLFPMTGEMVSMEMETVGAWEISALDASLKERGMSAIYSVHYCDPKFPLVDYEDYYVDEDYMDKIFARSSAGTNRTVALRICKKPVKNGTLASNITAHSDKPVCVIKHFTFTRNRSEFPDEGHIPEEVLRELDREVEKSNDSDSQPDLEGQTLNNTFVMESGEPLEEQRGPAFQPRVRKRSVEDREVGDDNLTLDVRTSPHTKPGQEEDEEEEEEANVSHPTPDVILQSLTELAPEQLNESKQLEMAEHHFMLDEEQEDNSTTDNLAQHEEEQEQQEETTVENFTKSLPFSTVPSHYQRSALKSLMSVMDSKLHGLMDSSRVQRNDAQGEVKEENQVLKVNSELQPDDFRPFNKVQGGLDDSGYEELGKIHLDLRLQDPQVNASDNRRSLVLEYDDYSEESNVSQMPFDFDDDLNIRSSDGKYRNYYIAAEEVSWDYGIKKPQQLIKPREMRRGMRKFFPEYKKAVFRAYLDKDFRHPATRGELEEHLGIMGPMIQAEINDLVIVTFKNLASRPYSFHLHGVYDRSQGVANGEPVEPNEVRVFKWKITRRQGPSAKEFDCKAGAYYSNLNMEKDIHSGLIGPMIVCKPGTLHPFYNIQPGVQQFALLFTVFDETKSWYLEENIRKFCTPPCRIKNEDSWFKFSNKFAAINGYVAETLPGLLVAQHHQIRWHLLNMGSNGEFHAVHFHGLPFTVRRDQEHRMGIFNLYPGVFGTVEMRPHMVGTWMVECTIGEHQLGGMRAKLLVYNSKCIEPLGMRTGRIADSQITDSGHYGSWESRLARLELSGSKNAWSGLNKNSWIQVDLLRPMLLQGIHTQGATHGLSESFVVQFILSYSLDQETWKIYKGNSTKAEQIFIGNVDGSRIKQNYFSPPILGRYIRVNPVTFQKRPTLRLELLGCDLNSCSSPLGMEKRIIPNHSISASSFLQTWFLAWSPSLARLNLDGTANAWRPKTNNPHEWLQVDFQKVKRVTGVITQGARSMLTHMMVTEFTVSISNDGRVWSTVLEEDSSRDKVFQGNNEHDEEAANIFEPPLFTRYIRIHPKGWYNDIALRLEFLGCDTQQHL